MNNWFEQPYETLTFSQVWKDYATFKADYDALIVGFAQNATPLKEASIQTTFYLLFAKYGNNPIANSDVGQFKMKIFSLMYAYGPLWERKQEIQDSLRKLTDADLLIGAKQIYNRAYNPASEPSTNSLEELTFINEQNTTNNKKSKMEAFSILWSILHGSATDEYMNKFKKCFAVFVDKMPVPFYIDNELIIEED
ncbi:MAG: hypothetical protein J6S85_06565 [Methanobrevibacter sp.]|nr:hypothetical protein [Methanobrevibacter sp.]